MKHIFIEKLGLLIVNGPLNVIGFMKKKKKKFAILRIGPVDPVT